MHKNKSFAIIPRAFYEYHKNNVEPVEFITNHDNIYDFCAGVKSKRSDKKGSNWYQLHWVDNGDYKTQKLSKTVRYFISNKGAYLIKHSEDGSQSHVEAPIRKGNRILKDWKVTYFNKSVKHNDFSKYDIDYKYYISKVNEWITDIKDRKQLSLF